MSSLQAEIITSLSYWVPVGTNSDTKFSFLFHRIFQLFDAQLNENNIEHLFLLQIVSTVTVGLCT